VWYYSGDDALYPNLYVVFVGPPAVGKGLVLGRINNLLRHHKYEKGRPIETNAGPEYPLLFPLGADSVTFEELMSDVAGSIRRLPIANNKIYAHTSYAFVLEELSSLFKRKTEDVVKFLLNAYDCKGYEYKTKHQGKDIIRALCLDFIAGTQFDFLRDAHKTGLFGQGFSSRTLFLFEYNARSYKFHISGDSEEQLAAKNELLVWLKKLSTIYGQLTYAQTTDDWLEHWYITVHVPMQLNAGEKMQYYYGRKKVALLKLAAAIHFSEQDSMVIALETFQKALALLDSIEPAMSQGLSFSGRNELHFYGRKMLQYIKDHREARKKHIYLEFGADMQLQEIEDCLKELQIGYNLKMKIENGDCIYYV
jgi:hypothetical protein